MIDLEKSYLFVPASKPERIAKALQTKADAIIIDLEDAVALAQKDSVRRSLTKAIPKFQHVEKKIILRINDRTTPFWKADVQFAARYEFLGVMLPKVNGPEDVKALATYLHENQEIIPLVETAKGIQFAYEIATASPATSRLAFGAIDYCLDLGISVSPTSEELLYPRSRVVVASRAAGLIPPIDTVFANFVDIDGLVTDAKRAKQLGFQAKLCIHPKQLDVVNEVFLPTEVELEWAFQVVSAFEQVEKEGSGSIQLNGKMVDYPVYKQAIQIIQRSRS